MPYFEKLMLVVCCVLYCGCTARVQKDTSSPMTSTQQAVAGQKVDAACALGQPEVIKAEEGSVLWRWTLEKPTVWGKEVLPKSDALARYRKAIINAGGVHIRPITDAPAMPNDRMKEVWRREFHNQDMALSGKAGVVRPIRCFESLFLAMQAERVGQLSKPTEFIVARLERQTKDGVEARVYFGASDTMFPPKSFYPFDAVKSDVEKGWSFKQMLHNHTVKQNKGKPALGTPAPSTNDVQLSIALAKQMGLESVVITNGFYSAQIPTSALSKYMLPVK